MNKVLVKVTVPEGQDAKEAVEKLVKLANDYRHIDAGTTFEFNPKVVKPKAKVKKLKKRK